MSHRAPSQRSLLIGALAAACFAAACPSDFTPYNEIDRLRILAMRADPPWLVPTSTGGAYPGTMLSALVTAAPGVDRSLIRYEWSWCPLRAGQSGAGEGVGPYECAFPTDMLPAELQPEPGQNIEETELFQLGTSTTAELDPGTLITAADIQTICDQLNMIELPEFIVAPSCDDGFEVSVRLIVRLGEQMVTGLHDLNLALDPAATQNNPTLEPDDPALPVLRATPLDAIDGAPSGEPIDLAADGRALARDQTYRLQLFFPDRSSETFVGEERVNVTEDDTEIQVRMRRENLVTTFFQDEGEAESTRRSYLRNDCVPEQEGMRVPITEQNFRDRFLPVDETSPECQENLQNGKRLEWTSPTKAQFDPDTLRLFVVMRDGRGGLDWFSRTVTLADPTDDAGASP